jgi:hypothetical protein
MLCGAKADFQPASRKTVIHTVRLRVRKSNRLECAAWRR